MINEIPNLSPHFFLYLFLIKNKMSDSSFRRFFSELHISERNINKIMCHAINFGQWDTAAQTYHVISTLVENCIFIIIMQIHARF